MKKSLMFGSFTLAEAKEKGRNAFNMQLSFDELELYQMMEESILKEAQVENIKYIEVNQPHQITDKTQL